MADKNIQMMQRNETNTDWDNLYPKTKIENVITSDGKTMDELLALLTAWENFKNSGGTLGSSGLIQGGSDGITLGKNGVAESMVQTINNQTTNAFSPAVNKVMDLGLSTNSWKDVYVGSFSKNTNGYTKLPNGFIIQWGLLTNHLDGAITLPIAFPTRVAAMTGSIKHYPDKWGGNLEFQNMTNSQFRVVVLNPPAQTYYVEWLAIGY